MSARDKWLRRSGFALAQSALALALLVSAAVTILGVNAAQSQQRQASATHAIVTTLNELRVAVDEAKAGADDYVLSDGMTGQSLYLEARARVSDTARQLAAYQGIGASLERDVKRVEGLAPAFITDLQSVMTLEQSGQRARAAQLLGAGSALQDAQSLRGALARIQTAENNTLRGQLAQAENAQRRATIIAILVTLLDIVLLVAFAFALRRISTMRERHATERAHAEERAHVLALEETNRQMRDFLNIASHEIRTPLTSLKISLQLAMRKVQRIAMVAGMEAVPSLLDQALSSTGQLERLAADFVDATRIEARSLGLRPGALDLGELVANCVAEQRLYHPGRAITLSTPGGGITVVADADRIRQVITNYMNNALKFSDEKSPVRISLSLRERVAEVRVRDQGPGITPEEQRHIWERFYRAPGSEHKSGSSVGFGLGLYICKDIIERHGGAVGVESAPGQGSTFWFILPLATAPETPETLDALPAGPSSVTPSAARSQEILADGE
jgi:signal transduction histidine kinase